METCGMEHDTGAQRSAFCDYHKTIHRFGVGLPEDWGHGYNHVTICCTCENKKMADARLPIFLMMSHSGLSRPEQISKRENVCIALSARIR